MLCNARGLSNVSFKLSSPRAHLHQLRERRELLLFSFLLFSKISKKLYILPRNEHKTKQNNKQTKYDDNDCPALNVFLLKLKVSIENEATIL